MEEEVQNHSDLWIFKPAPTQSNSFCLATPWQRLHRERTASDVQHVFGESTEAPELEIRAGRCSSLPLAASELVYCSEGQSAIKQVGWEAWLLSPAVCPQKANVRREKGGVGK